MKSSTSAVRMSATPIAEVREERLQRIDDRLRPRQLLRQDVPLLVHRGELAERLRAHLARRLDAALVERAGAHGVLQVVEERVRLGLAADLAVRPLLEAHAHVAEPHPPPVLAAIAGATFVFTQLVQAHGPSLFWL
jgi:hypothetical protein